MVLGSNRYEKSSYLVVLTSIVLGLYLSSRYSYLLFHGLIETVTIAVALTLFIVTWNTRRYLTNNYLRLLGIGYAFIALIDLLHTFAYKGINVFPDYGANLATQLWIAARYLQAATLFAAPLVFERKLNDHAVFGGFVVAVAALVGLVFSGNFPDCYIEGKGLTPFKIGSEYLISALLLASLAFLYGKRRYFNDKVFFLTACSIACTILSEMSFTAYASVYGFANLVGHFAKLVAFYLIYRAILVTGLKEPFDLTFRDLKQTEKALRQSYETLEEKVRERTAELRASEERYRSLIRKVQAAIVLHDGKGHILDSNPLAQELLGLTSDQLLGKSLVDPEWHFVREDGAILPTAEYPASLVLATRRPLRGYVTGIRRPERNEITWVLVNAEPEQDEVGEISLIIVSFVDITERKRAEEDLRCYKDQLEETIQQRTAELLLARDAAEAANQAKSVFLANMSHELRTPLNAILGFSSMMRREPQLTQRQRDNLDIINRSGEHLLTLINDVLEMAKIEAGRLQLEVAPFDLGGMVRDVTEMMMLRAQEKGLQLLLDQTSEFPRYIRGDEARLRQILINLVGNAVKFTEQGGVTIRLGVKQNAGHHLLIEVEDSGHGISAADQQRLFEPFVQLAEGGAQRGTGLGLSITRQFVKLMGGTIGVESTLGKGSLFRIELPVELASPVDVLKPESREHGEVEGLAPGQGQYRILIAEDQHDNQLLLSRLMDNIGLAVKVAENGEQCVKIFQEWHPDLIWMDRRMPVMDGVKATQCIRQLPTGRAVKIVAVTASAFKEQQQEMFDAGMDDFVRKPYRFEEIYACMARQLGIKYLYHSDTPAGQAPAVELSSAMLAVLPASLRMELRGALESLDGERISAALQRVGDVDLELSRILSHLVEYFDYPAILGALDEAGHPKDQTP